MCQERDSRPKSISQLQQLINHWEDTTCVIVQFMMAQKRGRLNIYGKSLSKWIKALMNMYPNWMLHLRGN